MLAFPFDECRDNRTIVRVQVWKLNIGKVFFMVSSREQIQLPLVERLKEVVKNLTIKCVQLTE